MGSSRSPKRCPRLISLVYRQTSLGFTRLTANLLILVLAIFDTGHENGSLIGEDQAVLDQVLIARVQDSVQHGLVEQEVAHPLGYYYVDLVEGQDHLFHLALQQGNLIRQAVYLDNLLCLFNNS